ncbi:MAG: YgfZ/GcvT domain-containing protein [Gemmataceae bacterium]
MSEPTPLHGQIARHGAVCREEAGWIVPSHFGNAAEEYAAARRHAAIFDLSYRGQIQITGTDAASFLHNFCTHDIQRLPAGQGREAFFTTVKAKVIAHAWIDHRELPDGSAQFWLDTTAQQGEILLQHLNHYLISEDVTLSDKTRQFVQLHLAGPDTHEILETALGETLPRLRELHHETKVFSGDTVTWRRHDWLNLLGYDLFCASVSAASVWQALVAAGARPAGQDAFEWLRVEAGFPLYGVDIDADRFVVELDRAAQAISYTKGCYLGQEPIVMARDRGHVNRWLRGLKVSGAIPPARAAPVLRQGETVGEVTSAVVSPRLGVIALAYLRRGHDQPGTPVEVVTDQGSQPAEVTSLPFTAQE